MKIIVATITCDTEGCKNFVISDASMNYEVKAEKLSMKKLGWTIEPRNKSGHMYCPNCSHPDLTAS